MYTTKSGGEGQRRGKRRSSRRKSYDNGLDSVREPRGGQHTYPPIRPTDMPADIILPRLRGVTGCRRQWSALCPGHHDTRPSLSITEAEDGRLLVYCHAGYDTSDILDAIDLDESYLFPSPYAVAHRQRSGAPYRSSRPGPQEGHCEPAPDYALFAASSETARQGSRRHVRRLASRLGLPPDSLQAIGIGWLSGKCAFPEFDDCRRPVGMVLRDAHGQRRAIRGSLRGLTIPRYRLRPEGPIYVAEGATDTAALYSVGVHAIGRPMARVSGAVRLWLTRYLEHHGGGCDIIVVGDRDKPRNGVAVGARGAKELALYLSHELSRHITWALPQREYKDVREQICAGQWRRHLVEKEVRA